MAAPDVADTLLISMAGAGMAFVNNAVPRQNRDTFRVVEIMGGLMATQMARSPYARDIGAGMVVGALVGFVQEQLTLGSSSTTARQVIRQQVRSPSSTSRLFGVSARPSTSRLF